MYQLFSDIKITEGFKRDLLIDLGREKVHLIPKELTALIKDLPTRKIFTPDEQLTISELLAVEWIFECEEEESHLFLAIPEDWDYPASITNAVIELGNENLGYFNFLLMELINNGCFYVQMIIPEKLSSEALNSFIEHIHHSDLLGVGLILNYFSESYYSTFIENFFALKIVNDDVIIFGCEDKYIQSKYRQRVKFIEGNYKASGCGLICKKHFSVSVSFYNESQHYNTCLNRKVFIDKNGDVKNCPALATIFGNVKTMALKAVVSKSDFQELGQIRKEKIKVCRDCEYRNICSDCRAFLEDPLDRYSKPLKCGYNPYTNEWKEWSTLPEKQKSITFYKSLGGTNAS